MAICIRCGQEFDLTTVRKKIGQMYGAGLYNDYYPDGDVCEYCAIEEMSADYATGAEIIDLMGPGWDDD